MVRRGRAIGIRPNPHSMVPHNYPLSLSLSKYPNNVDPLWLRWVWGFWVLVKVGSRSLDFGHDRLTTASCECVHLPFFIIIYLLCFVLFCKGKEEGLSKKDEIENKVPNRYRDGKPLENCYREQFSKHLNKFGKHKPMVRRGNAIGAQSNTHSMVPHNYFSLSLSEYPNGVDPLW